MLVDREFAVDIMLALNGLGKKFLMPATKTPGIKKAILEHHRGRRAAVSACNEERHGPVGHVGHTEGQKVV